LRTLRDAGDPAFLAVLSWVEAEAAERQRGVVVRWIRRGVATRWSINPALSLFFSYSSYLGAALAIVGALVWGEGNPWVFAEWVSRLSWLLD